MQYDSILNRLLFFFFCTNNHKEKEENVKLNDFKLTTFIKNSI